MFTIQLLFEDDADSWSNEKRVSKYAQGYYNCESKKAILYHQVMVQLAQSIYKGDTQSFNEINSFLDLISKSEDDKLLKRLFESETNPIRRTNVVILCCKHNQGQILELTLNNECDILANTSTNVGRDRITPSESDDESHNAFYYALKTLDLKIIEMLLDKWPDNNFSNNSDAIETILSGAYKELKLRNVEVSFEIDVWVQSKLLDLRFCESINDNEQKSKQSPSEHLSNIKVRIEILQEAYTELQKYDQCQINHNIFILIIKFISQNIHILKRLLKSTYVKLPWEEIEFCLVSYVWAYTKNEEICLFYRLALTKSRILYHLRNFLCRLRETTVGIENFDIEKLNVLPTLIRSDVKQLIIDCYAPFYDLYQDYEPLRNIRSLDILKHFLKQACKADINNFQGRLIVTRSLQIIGEHLKNSLESPKLSDYLIEKLILPHDPYRLIFSSYLTRDARKIIIELRNALNHCNSLLESKYSNSTDIIFFSDLQQDLRKLTKIFVFHLYEEKIRILNAICEKTLHTNFSCDQTDWKHFLAAIQVEDSDSIAIEVDDINRVSELTNELEMAISQSKNEKITFLFQFFKRIIELEKDRLIQVDIVYRLFLDYIINFSFCSPYNRIFLRCKELVNLRDLTDKYVGMVNNYDDILRMSVNIIVTLRSCVEDSDRYEEACVKFITEIFSTIVYKANDVNHMKSLWSQLMIQDKVKKKKKYKTKGIKKKKQPDIMNKLYQLQSQLASINCAKDFLICVSKENITSLEVLLLDLMSTLKDSLNRVAENQFFLDDVAPVLNGNSQRQHLAHINDAFEILDSDSSVAVVLNVRKLVKEDLKRTDIMIGKTVKSCVSNLLPTLKKHISFLVDQNSMLKSIRDGNIFQLKSLISNGGDSNSKIGITKRSLLHIAASSGDLAMFQYLLSRNLSVHLKDTDGISILHVAAEANAEDVVKLCLNLGSVVDSIDNVGRTPLHMAAESGSICIVNYLLDNRAKVDSVCNLGLTPLIYALRNNKMEMVRHLLSRNAKLSHTEINREMFIAAESPHEKVLDFLVSSGADINRPKLEDGITPLIWAIKVVNLNMVRRLLELGAEVNKGDVDGTTPLHFGVEVNNEEIVSLLLDREADVLVANCTGFTAVHLASISGNEKILHWLIEKGVSINVTDKKGQSPLHLASLLGHCRTVQILLEYGASVICKNVSGEVPFHTAVKHGHVDIANLLMNHGAEIDHEDSCGVNPLFMAAQRGHQILVDLLLVKGCDINVKDRYGITLINYAILFSHKNLINRLIEKNIDLKVKDLEGRSSIHYATFLGDIDIVKQLIERGCDINEKDKNLTTPLHYAVSARNIDMVSYLINNGADIGAVDVGCKTPLTEAVERSPKQIVDILIAAGADVNVCDKDGTSLISHAITRNRKDVLNFLLVKGAKVNIGNNKGLLWAIRMAESYNFVEILIRNKVDLTVGDDKGWTALHWAAYLNKLEILQLLLDKGGNVNCLNSEGSKPIHLGAQEGHAKIVQALLLAGSEVDSPNNKDMTPLHLAALDGNEETVNILIDGGADVLRYGNNGLTALHLSTLEGHLRTIFTLINDENVDMVDKAGRTPLCVAAVRGHLNIVNILIEKGASVNAPNSCFKENVYDLSPLQCTVPFGYKDVVQVLLEKGALVNLVNKTYWTALHQAVKGDYKEIVKMLLDFGANIDSRDIDQSTPLHLATFHGFEEIASMLINRGAQTNLQDFEGSTPLHLAVCREHTAIVKTLLERGVDINLCDKNNLTSPRVAFLKGNKYIVELFLNHKLDVVKHSLHIAVSKGHASIVSMLLDRGYDINERERYLENENVNNCITGTRNHAIHYGTPLDYAVLYGHEEIVELLIAKNAEVNNSDEEGITPLHIAAQKGFENITHLLINCGSNINCKSKSGGTPLHYAVSKDHIAIVELLIDKKAELDCIDNQGITPLSLSATLGNCEIAQVLINNRADIEFLDYQQRRPIHRASFKGNCEVLNLLIQSGAQVDPKDSSGITPLRLACQAGHQGAVKILLDSDVDIKRKCNAGHTPLHISSYLGHNDIVKLLVNNKADVNIKGNEGTSPLHMAAQNGHELVVDTLLKSGADVNIVDDNSVSPLHLAAYKRHVHIVEMLIEKGASLVKNSDNETTLDLALNQGPEYVVKILLNKRR